MYRTKLQSFILNAIIITLSTLGLRSLDTVFGVWISNRLGAQGIGLYQLVTSVYGFAITFSISGLSFAVTRVVSESAAKGERPFRTVAVCLLLSLVYSITASSILFCGSDFIAANWLGDKRASLSLKVFSFALPFLAAGSCLRGYFIASKMALRTVIGDILEQFTRISAISLALTFLMPPDIEYACCAVVLGSLISELLSFFYYLFSYLMTSRRCSLTLSPAFQGMLKRILRISLPVAFGAYLRSALVTAENLLIPRGLISFGFSSATALSQYGLIKGMVLPVLTFPSAIISSFALLLVPEVAETNILGDHIRITTMTQKSLKVTFLYAMLSMGIFLCFGQRIGSLLYPDTEAGKYIFILAPIIPLLYIDFVVDNLLKALDQQVTSLKFNTIDALFRTLLVLFLLPLTGTLGYLMILFVGSALNAVLSIRKLLQISGVRLSLSNWIIKPLLCSAAASAFSSLLLRLLPSTFLSLLLSILFSIILYIPLLIITNSIKPQDFSLHRLKHSKTTSRRPTHS